MEIQTYQKLLTYKKRTISQSSLEEMIGRPDQTYAMFAKEVLGLEEAGYLTMVESTGRNRRTPSLANQYRINKSLLNKEHHRELQQFRLKFNDAIHLDEYFNLDRSTWERDLPYLEKIHTYIEQHGFPQDDAAAPERSFELVGDEKWISEHQGHEVLHRTQLWDQLRIFPVSDPLMFAINPQQMTNDKQFHLIVENKTTYQALLPVITQTHFSTLIYGSGNKIPKSIENFQNQFPIEAEHIFFYFGDIDNSGITIWHSLNNRERAIPALPFYLAALQKEKVYGKTNQRPNEQALTNFVAYFEEDHQKQIRALLAEGAYYPQEVLKTKELQKIWEESAWKQLIGKN